MADGDLRLKASADFRNLTKEVERVKRQNEKLEDRINKMGDATTKAGNKSTKASRLMIRNATQVVAGYVGIQAAISLVNRALSEEIALRERAVQTNKTVQEQRLLLQFQQLSFTEEQRDRFDKTVSRIGNKASLSRAESLSVARTALSATDDANVEDRIRKSTTMMDTMGQVLGPMLKDFPELVGAALDLKRSLGETATNEDTVKFIANAISISRLQDPKDVPNLIRTIAATEAILKSGSDDNRRQIANETLALFSAFQSNTSEVIGATTSTAISNFVVAMRKRTGRDDLTPNQLLQLVDKEDPEFQKLIRGKSFSKPVQLELAEKTSKIATDARSALEAIEKLDKDPGAFQRLVDVQQGRDDVRIRSFLSKERVSSTIEEELAARSAVPQGARKAIAESLTVTSPGPGSFLRRKATEFGLFLDPDPIGSSRKIARNAAIDQIVKDRTGVGDSIFTRQFHPIKRLVQQALFSGLSDEEIESRLPQGGTARVVLEELRLLQEAQIAEQQRLARIEADRRNQDNTKLAATVGRAVNTSAQHNRIVADQEN